MPDWMPPNFPIYRVLASVLFAVVVVVVRLFVRRWILGSTNTDSKLRRQWLAQARNLTFVSLLIGLGVVWAPQIHSAALSVFAIAAAIVIAVKELIMCVSGSILRAGARSFSIGDRIEVNGHRGDVIDQSLLSTTMFEIGPGQTTHQYTGRVLVLPNSVFLNSVVINETYSDQFVLHAFSIPFDREHDWVSAERELLAIAKRVCQDFLEDAREHMTAAAKREGLIPPSVEPRVTVQVVEPKRLNFFVRIPTPVRERGRLEQSIVREFLSRSYAPAKSENSGSEPAPS